MALAANPAMYVDQWMKPFGSDSDRREWLAVTVPERAKLLQADTRFGGIVHAFHSQAQRNFWKPLDQERVKPKLRQPVVKVKFFAHDRLVLSSYVLPPDIRKGLNSKLRFRDAVRRSQFLVSRRESQGSFNVLGNWRSKPMRTRFTTYAKNMTRDAAHMLEMHGAGTCVFATLTAPGSTPESFEVVAAGSGDICNRFNTWLRDHVTGGDFLYVWELQERGAPHLHYMFRLPETTNLETFGKAMQREWRQILLSVSESSEVDLFRRDKFWTWKDHAEFPRCDVRPVTHTFERYISKYISKSRSKGGVLHHVYPRRWWGCSNGLRRLVKARRFEEIVSVQDSDLGIEALQSVVAQLGSTADGVMYFERFKGCGQDSVSIRLPPGQGFEIGKAVVAYLEDGDLSQLECALIAAHEHVHGEPLQEVPE